MSLLTEPRLQLLTALLVKSVAEPGDLALATGVEVSLVEGMLRAEEARGLVGQREGVLRGWALTEEGRAEVARLLCEERALPGVRSGVRDAYQRFMDLNPRLLGVCTRWQVRSSGGAEVVNDHSDPAYDEGVALELVELNEEVRPVLGDLAGLLGRFAGYRPRLDGALERVRAGAPDWFSSPRVDSYHSVWFELHEDLLATLGMQRSDEVRGA